MSSPYRRITDSAISATARSAALSPGDLAVNTVSGASLVFLAVLGALGAQAGGAPIARATARVTFWGVLAMAVAAGNGSLVGKAV
ncbi:VIT1/CCC1 family predicted Fe2+/Mn2+ transporter [Methylobacterium sp. PvR107]|nr:VIT1/CCC1 family predicted Fe2+/Mn2+ transporter [Methylobacterium sp. PvR107]